MITCGLDALAEVEALALGLARRDLPSLEEMTRAEGFNEEERIAYATMLQGTRFLPPLMLGARIVIWKKETWSLAQAGAAAAFEGWRLPEAESHPELQYWIFEEPLRMGPEWAQRLNIEEADTEGLLLHGFLIHSRYQFDRIFGRHEWQSPDHDRDGLLATALFVKAGTRRAQWADGTPLSVFFNFAAYLFEGEAALGEHAPFLAGLQFMRQTVADVREEALPRQARRKRERERKPTPTIQTVHLRRREHPKRAGIGHPGWEYSCRFVVMGHWRKRGTNSTNPDGPPIWVRAYLKGPDDAPLKGRTQLFYKVDR